MKKSLALCGFVALVFCSQAHADGQRFRASSGDRHKLRVDDPAIAAQIVADGGTLVADYGSFQIVEANSAAAKSFAASGKVEDRDEDNRILLNAGVLDTTADAVKLARRAPAQFAGRRLHLVQFAGPVKAEWVAELEQAGLRLVTYIPNNAYLVYGDARALAALESLAASAPHVQWQGAYEGDDRIQPRARNRDAAGTYRALGTDLFAIQLVDDPDANAETLALIDSIKLAPLRRQSRELGYFNFVAQIPPDQVAIVAAQPDVVSINTYTPPKKFDERQNQIVAGNLNAAGSAPTNSGYLNWLYSKGFTQDQFTASGFVVDVCDSGLDVGTTTPNHFGLYQLGDTALVSRVAYARLEGTANSGSTIQGCDGHGTINGHIIGGYNDRTGFPHADSLSYRYGLGVCPFVRLGSSVIFDPDNFTDPDYEDMISRAYRDGARISSDSWGADTAGDYDIDAQRYDYLVRDAQPSGAAVSSNGNQEMTIVFAAGNAGSSAGTVGSPGTAKNVITVGAAENVHSHAITNGGASTIGNDGCETPDSEANNANDIASFSSRGPCSDLRKKPEIVAPGTHITGGVAQQSRTMTGTGDDLACFAASGVCGLLDNSDNYINFFPTNQQWYTTSSGTSHSTPAVAGGCALIRQYFINIGQNAPSPAMVKAYLMNAARYMTGVSANDTLWSNSQGMGMMNLGFAFDGVGRVLRDQLTNDLFTASGQQRTFTGRVTTNSKPFRVALSWTDAPGSTSGNAYNNDLDLTVVINGQTYKGNVFSGSNSVAGGSADTRNNTECVFLPAGTTGTVVVTVRAANINSDGVPNFGGSLDQDFALVAYNMEEVQLPSVTLAGWQLVAENCGLGNGELDPDELVTIGFILQNVGSANTTNVVATLQANGGVTAPSGAQSYGALLAGGAAATNPFSFTAAGVCGGTVTAVLALVDGATDLGSIVQTFTLGSTLDATITNANSAPITIRDSNSASPYPGTINVAGMAGAISKVVVTLSGFSHTYPADVDVIVVSPDGKKVSLMGAVGGGNSVNNAVLVFDDAAASQIGSTITSGTWQPTGMAETMPSPAPADPYASALSEFNGSDPNGTWSLYVADFADGDSGSIASGWKLAITAGEPFCCASNQPPFLRAIGNRSVIESNSLVFTVTAADLYDGDTITLTASNLPAGATFPESIRAGSVTGTFTWAEAAPTGTYNVTFYASDKDGVDTEAITVAVNPVPYVDTNCAVLFSEYVEGSSNNKAVEIYNPGSEAIDLAAGQYVVQVYANGSSSASATINLTGTIPADDVYVLANSSAGAAVLGAADQTSGSLNHNGDDALVLRSGGASGAVIDRIGQVGNDPGTEWGSGLTSTADNTLRRKASIPRGDTNTVAAFDPATEWDGYAVDTFDGLGSHTSDCSGPALPTPPILNAIGNKSVQVSNTLQFAVTATPTDGDTVTLTASNLPSGAVFYPTNEVASFFWTNASPTGTYSVTFHAADKDGFDAETIAITVNASGSGSGEALDIGGWVLIQSNSSQTVTIPAGTLVQPGGHVIVARNATKAAFESGWGVSLGSEVVYINSSNRLPQINGDEQYLLEDDTGTLVDGTTPASLNPNGNSIQRTNLLGTASAAGSWLVVARASATPGVSVQGDGTAGLRISEYSDAVNFSNEFVELHYDATGGASSPPVLNTIGAKSVTVSNDLQFNVVATPTDGDAVTLTASNLPSGAVFYPTNEAGSFVWTNASPTGTYNVTFYASDKDGVDQEAVAITVGPGLPAGLLDISGWKLKQYNSSLTYTIPDGTFVAPGGYVIIARKNTREQFEAAWGVTLDASVVFLDSSDKGVQINGSEQYDLLNAFSTLIDGTTPASLNPSSSSIQRTNLLGDASAEDSWQKVGRDLATPGTGASGDETAGLRISEYSDATSFSNEFVELYYDAPAEGAVDDTDQDGLLDSWEYDNFGTLTNEAAGDFDQDGFSNLDELIAVTQPTNDESYLRMSDLSFSAGQRVSFDSATGRVYTILFNTNLLSPNWQNLGDGVEGTDGVLTITDTNDATHRVYRLGVARP